MQLTTLDWTLIIAYFAITLWIGLRGSSKSGENANEYFLSGRSMPWWLLGVSLVATTFSCDTPNLVTDIVRNDGVAGNWAWWAFLLTGMLTVFVYAQLWRRSGLMTDLGFYELRYSGKEAAFLRMFRALYLGVFFNVMIMATVSLAAIKIGRVMFDASPVTTLIFSAVITVAYSTVGGFRAVLLTDFVQFFIAMLGSIWAAVEVLGMPEIGGMAGLFSHPNVVNKLSLVPDFNDTNKLIPLLIMPLAVQWWSVWYPGAEPGGGGYVAQRMLAAKDEKNAIAATLFFNIAHYAFRPWPWIIVALGSLVIYPELADIQRAFPNVEQNKIGNDLGYPAMMTLMPAGLVGLIVASLASAYMSTIATHLNWGSSYVVNDFYLRFINPNATDKQAVNVGRFSTVILMVLASFVALALESAKSSFDILLQIGAGTGLLFILRWFWWRINAWSELTAMVVSFLMAVFFFVGKKAGFLHLEGWQELLIGIAVTTASWLAATLLTKPSDHATLISFFKLIRPHASGWQPVVERGMREGTLNENDLPQGKMTIQLLCMFLGCVTVYAALFCMGFFMYGQTVNAAIGLIVTAVSAWLLFKNWARL